MLTLPPHWAANCQRDPAMPLLGLPGRSLVFRDPVELAERMGQLMPVRSCDPVRRPSPSAPFRCHGGALQLGPLDLVALWGTGLQGEVEGCERSTLVVPYRGRGDFRIGRRSLSNLTGHTLLLVPPGPWRTYNDVLGGLTIRVDPGHIQAVCRTMDGPAHRTERWLGMASTPLVREIGKGANAAPFERLYRFLAFLDGVVRRHGEPPEALRLDDLLLRLIVELLTPALLHEPRDPDPRHSTSQLDSLLDWMHAHCHESISLTDLEQRSHYSRRSLQYAFRARFDCGPMQYLRRQRLWLARRRLEQAPPGSTVRDIAHTCGYLSVSSFRRDFLARFAVAPSTVLARRSGRRGNPAERPASHAGGHCSPPPMAATALPDPVQQLQEHLHQTRLLGSISSALYFDQNTVMPAAGAAWRGEQLALLARQLHERQSSAFYADLLAAAEAEVEGSQTQGSKTRGNGAPTAMRRNLALLRQELERQQRLDPDLVGQIAAAQSRGNAVWQEAKRRDDFAAFAPALTEMIRLRRAQAAQLADAEPVARSPWEILAQTFEPDISTARLQALFAPLTAEIPVLLEQLRAADPPEGAAPDLPEGLQDSLCAELLASWGYDPSRCLRARSAHPFSCTVGPHDFRITTRVVPDQPLAAFLATAHEWGHSLYEQGLPRGDDHYFPWPLGEATSMGVHESQSLFWECRVARSRAFAAHWHPRFVEGLGRDPWGDADGFWRSLNPLRPGTTRVEAGELSYCLHIVLRFELELALLEQEMPVAELPGRWRERMGELLGVVPASDREGCLQDIHWAEGLFGYFPSYALGHLISAQLTETMEGEIGPIETVIAAGESARLREWLGRKVWPLGRSVNGAELVEQLSGRPLEARPFLDHLERKLAEAIGPACGTP